MHQTCLLAVLIWALLPRICPADDFRAGARDEQILGLLRVMARDLPLRTMTLNEVAPEFVVEKVEGLTWTQAVAEAEKRFGRQQPARGVFLSKYLEKGSPETCLTELQWADAAFDGGSNYGHSKSFIVGAHFSPVATISTWLENSRPQLQADATLSMSNINVNGTSYEALIFNRRDHLIRATQKLAPEENGTFVSFAEDATEEKGANRYYAWIVGINGEFETVDYTPELRIKERSVTIPGTADYREFYEAGQLRKRLHYGKRKNDLGGEDSILERTEKFP